MHYVACQAPDEGLRIPEHDGRLQEMSLKQVGLQGPF
jgi:hypothetical protein